MLASEYTTRIDNAHQLQLMAMNPAATYALDQNIAASTSGSGTDVWGSSGFIPIGNSTTAFTGTLDGLGFSVSGLTINLPSNTYVGLIGLAGPGSVIENIGTVGGSITGSSYVGGLIGKSRGTVTNTYATGSVRGTSSVGGLLGQSGGAVTESYATGSVTGSGNGVGGLVGQSEGSISDSYATGSATTSALEVGGLVGQNYAATVSNSYATGKVSGAGDVGGLVGNNVGSHAAIGLTYAAGEVSGSGSNVGGLVGANTGNIAESYWDVTTSGQSAPLTGATGLTTAQMQTAANFGGFNFTTTPGASGNNWVMVDFDGSLNNARGAQGAVLPMLASEYSTTIDNAHQLQLMAMNLGATYTLGQNIVIASATGTSADVWGGSGFIPIGVYFYVPSSSITFTGTFNGLGHTVNDLTTNFSGSRNAGLIGISGPGSVIENVGMVGVKSFRPVRKGALVGYNEGTVSNSYSTAGNLSAPYGYAGGLVGYNEGTISNSYSNDNLSGGGLVGFNAAGGKIIDSYATGNENGGGGLVNTNSSGGIISNSYATGNVNGGGGLVSSNDGTITNSYANGQRDQRWWVGEQ